MVILLVRRYKLVVDEMRMIDGGNGKNDALGQSRGVHAISSTLVIELYSREF